MGPSLGPSGKCQRSTAVAPLCRRSPRFHPRPPRLLVEAPLAPTPLEQLDLVGNDPMTGVMPSALPNPPAPISSFPDLRGLPSCPSADTIYAVFPIPPEFDCERIVRWGELMCTFQFCFDVATLKQLTALSGHTGIHATCVLEALHPIFSLG